MEEKVTCPWCGGEMFGYCSNFANEAGFSCKDCGATSPEISFSNDLYETNDERDEVAYKLAYAAAIKRYIPDTNK